ncbi:MAG: element excision factor XisI family protein [Trichodesmium sp. St16_bin4-tuft]|nr:element excision factor XisI family protein [Trichodesmium sp. St4_bin8_1]MDE5074177.1 element excision factor XisI family protein [Trichodesmium sp. St5_bin8]MDE5078706.1 element excision factor XisI family protein [Trichodesmium sp. St2_bin6]MDE5092929.1 element excision factor XisI family protein [Trichodesmium sp. St11_bin5]MDE5099561.1 element excision factor XisI family protein [Trichodesmium sp. St16_bin4-tuft]MDE5101874.1 element excision factor XisI family protein [Trichodesmium sp
MKINGLEDGIAKFLVNAGIPKSQIVLGFHPVEVSSHSEFAVN